MQHCLFYVVVTKLRKGGNLEVSNLLSQLHPSSALMSFGQCFGNSCCCHMASWEHLIWCYLLNPIYEWPPTVCAELLATKRVWGKKNLYCKPWMYGIATWGFVNNFAPKRTNFTRDEWDIFFKKRKVKNVTTLDFKIIHNSEMPQLYTVQTCLPNN